MNHKNNYQEGGFTYLFMLLALTCLSFSLLKNQDSARIDAAQQREAELLFRGEQLRDAINRYQKANYANGCFPENVDDLLLDKRGKKPVYHLRQRFSDPMTDSEEWGKNYDKQGRWIGVHSLGKGIPLRKSGFHADQRNFAKAKSYSGWVFAVKTVPQAPLPKACRPARSLFHSDVKAVQ